MVRVLRRVKKDDPDAINNCAIYYRDGERGFTQNYKMALKLFHRSGKLGCSEAYCSIGYAYDTGQGVKVDEKKAVHYYELAAKMGNANARYNLSRMEINAGNMDRAIKHQ